MLLRSIIKKLNKNLEDNIPGLRAFGLTQTIVRTSGSQEEILPGEVGVDGEVTYVGIDDIDKIRIYHRNSGITTTRSTQQGRGDDYSDIINRYQMSMIVYLDHKRTKLFPEELFLFIQSNMPDAVKIEPDYKSITLQVVGVVINRRAVFIAEYGERETKLPPEKSLFQINYVIESRHQKSCFVKCPEDC